LENRDPFPYHGRTQLLQKKHNFLKDLKIKKIDIKFVFKNIKKHNKKLPRI